MHCCTMAFVASSPSPVAAAAGSMLLHGTGAGGAPSSARLSVLRSGAAAQRQVGPVALSAAVAVPGGGGTAAPLLARTRPRCTASRDNVSPSEFYEGFLEYMEQFRYKYPATALLKEHKKELEATSITAKKCISLLTTMVKDRTTTYINNTNEEVVHILESFLKVEKQCAAGYARAKTIVDAMDGLKLMVLIFGVGGRNNGDLTHYPRPSSDTNGYLKELVKCFQKLSNEVEAKYKNGGGIRWNN